MGATVRLTMAQALLRYLAAQRTLDAVGREVGFVRGVFGIFGHGNVTGIGQALEEHGDLDFVQGHNEQGMVHAATAYARQSLRRRIWACTTSVGPGAMNLVTGAATATVNRIPVLLLPGDVFASRAPDPVLQQLEHPMAGDASVNDALRPVSVYWDRIVRPEQLLRAAPAAMGVLTDAARTGAVTLCLPQDVQCEAWDYPAALFAPRLWPLDPMAPAPEAIARAASVLASARRPLLVVGGGVRYGNAAPAVDAFARAFEVPFVETQAGKGALLWEHPLNAGAVGVTGSLAGNRLAREADVVVGVGTRWSDFTTASRTAFAPDARFVNINVQAADAHKFGATAVTADAALSLRAIALRLADGGYRSAYAAGEIAALRRQWAAEVDRLYAAPSPGDGADGLAQTRVLGLLAESLGPDDILVNAAGGLPGDLHRLWRTVGEGTYHMEYGFSCMGYEIAGAVGVKLAEPQRQVFALVGDGSFLMLHSELFTALQQGIKITVVVFNNGGYQCIHSLQRGHGSAGFGNEFRARSGPRGELGGSYLPIDFAAVAAGLGAVGLAASDEAGLRAAIAAAREADRSVVIDVRVAPGSQTDGYAAWWDVPVAEASRMAAVEAARSERRRHLADIRPV